MRIKILIVYTTTNRMATYINSDIIPLHKQTKKLNIEAYKLDFYLELCYKDSV